MPPTPIPDEVVIAARGVLIGIHRDADRDEELVGAIAGTIVAERERAASIAETPSAFMPFDGDFEGNQIAAAIRDGTTTVTVEKQIVKVLEAVNGGCETSDQVAAVTGLPIAHCSVYLGNLVDDGLIRLVKREGRWLNRERGGRKSNVYAPRDGKAA